MRAASVVSPGKSKRQRKNEQGPVWVAIVTDGSTVEGSNVKYEKVVTGVCHISRIVYLSNAQPSQYKFLWPPESCMEWQCEASHKLHENHVLEKPEIKGVQSVVYNFRFSNLIPQLQGVTIGVLLPKLQHDSFWAEGKNKFVTSDRVAVEAGLVELVDMTAEPIRDMQDTVADDVGNGDLEAMLERVLDDDADGDPNEHAKYKLDAVVVAVKISMELKDQAQFEKVIRCSLDYCNLKSHAGKVDFPDQSTLRRWKKKMDHKVHNKISAEFKSHHGGHKVHNKIWKIG